MKSVTSCVRSGLYVASSYSRSVISPAHSSSTGGPYASRSGARTSSVTCTITGYASRAQAAAPGAGARTACGDAAGVSARAHRERGANRRLRALREARLRRGRGYRHAARARARRRRERPPRRRRPADPAGLRRAGPRQAAARAARDPHRVRPPGLPARCRVDRAAAPLGRPCRRDRRLLDRRVAPRRARRGDPRGTRRPALRATAAVRARVRDDHGAAGADGAALRLQRAEHDRRLHPDGSRPRAPARARLRRPPAQQARATGRVHHAGRGAPPRSQLPLARRGPLRLAARGDDRRRRRRARASASRRSSFSRSSRTRSSTARPTGRCTCSSARASGEAACV